MDNPVGRIEVFRPIMIGDVVVISTLAGRLMFLLAFGIFVIFSLVLVRQVWLMDKTIQTPLAPFLKIVSLSMLMVTTGLFFLVMVGI